MSNIFNDKFKNGITPLNADNLNLILEEIIAIKNELANKANISYVNSKLNTKQNELISGINIKTINGQSILNAGNFTVEGTLDENPFEGKVFEENPMADFSVPPARRVEIEGVTKPNDILNFPLYIKSQGADYVHFKVNGMLLGEFYFASSQAHAAWETAGEIYVAIYDGAKITVYKP